MTKIKVLSSIILLASLISCQQYPSEEEIWANIDAGYFTVAEHQIQFLIQDKNLPGSLKKNGQIRLKLWIASVKISACQKMISKEA
jgi:hypothetical protein